VSRVDNGCLASAVILKPDTFEGLRFDFTRPLNQNFAICHSLFAGNVEVPTNNAQVIKMPMGTYEFGANLVSNQVSGEHHRCS
jgi:mitochondrial import receptor subunit TOM40